MARVKYPEGTPSMGFGGVQYEADEHGNADVPSEYVADAVGFGAVAVVEEAEPEEGPLAIILKGNVDDVRLAVFNEETPLTDEQLVALEQLEQEGKARKGVLDAIAAEQTAREEAED